MKIIAQSENIEDFLDSDFIYVDKTEYIYNLVSNSTIAKAEATFL